MPLQSDLIQKVQSEYIGAKYKDGLFAFPSLDDETIEVIVRGFLKWAQDKGFVKEGKLDLECTDKW